MYANQLGGAPPPEMQNGGSPMGMMGGMAPTPAAPPSQSLPVSQAPGKQAIMEDFTTGITAVQALATKYPVVSTQLNQVITMLTETMVALGDKSSEASTALPSQGMGNASGDLGSLPQGGMGGKIPLA